MAPTTRRSARNHLRETPKGGEDQGQAKPPTSLPPPLPKGRQFESKLEGTRSQTGNEPFIHSKDSEETAQEDKDESQAEPSPTPQHKPTRKGKPSKGHDASYRPPKRSEESEDTGESEEWDESDLDKPSFGKSKAYKPALTRQKAPTKKQSKHVESKVPTNDAESSEEEKPPPKKLKSQKKAAGTLVPKVEGEDTKRVKDAPSSAVVPGAQIYGTLSAKAPRPVTDEDITMQRNRSKDYMPPIPGFNNIFQGDAEAKPSASSRRLAASTATVPQLPVTLKTSTERTGSSITDHGVHGADSERPQRNKHGNPVIPGFADIFQILPGKNPHAIGEFKPSFSFIKRKPPALLVPDHGPVVPGPSTMPPAPTTPVKLEIEPPGPSDTPTGRYVSRVRDWPPYPGTVYCNACFSLDLLRALDLRRKTVLVLRLLGDDYHALHDFITSVKWTDAMRSPPAAGNPRSYFHQQLSPDLTSLILLQEAVDRQMKQPLFESSEAAITLQIKHLLADLRDHLNLTEQGFQRIREKWSESMSNLKARLEELDYDQPKVQRGDIPKLLGKGLGDLESILSLNLTPSAPDPLKTDNDDDDGKDWKSDCLDGLSKEIEDALKHIKAAAAATTTTTTPSKQDTAGSPDDLSSFPNLHCYYCSRSGAVHKIKADRPYPRDMEADAQEPWTEACKAAFPWRYDKDGNKISPPADDDESQDISTCDDFITALSGKKDAVYPGTLGDIMFLVCRSGNLDPRIVLIRMKSLFEGIVDLYQIPVVPIRPKRT